MSTETGAVVVAGLGWQRAAKLLAAPGLVAGIGGVLLWLMRLLERHGVERLPLQVKYVLLPVFVVGAFTAGWGAFLAPLFVIPALLIAVIRTVGHRASPAPSRGTWSWVALGLAGVVIAWTAVPLLGW
jgi:hypothetical protein